MVKPFVVILIGPPGSGKGTQAGFIAEKFGLYHFDNSQEFRQILEDPENQDDPVISEQRRRFAAGLLFDPAWFYDNLIKCSSEIIQSGKGMVFSASPRSLYEAERFLPDLENLVGKDRIIIFEIVLSQEASIFRNSHRRICKTCGYSLMWSPENEKLSQCPKCGGELEKRVLDKPEVIKERLKVYSEETYPVLSWLRERGYDVVKINGEPLPDEVWKEILSHLEKPSFIS